MTNPKYSPVKHDHEAFLAKARARPGFNESYEGLKSEYELASLLMKAPARALIDCPAKNPTPQK
jgi:hypothetical protein